MRSILVFIDGMICDDRHRLALYGTDAFAREENILRDRPVPGSVAFLNGLAASYDIIYIGARTPEQLPATTRWLSENGFPDGDVYLAPEQADRLAIVRETLIPRNVVYGIGDRWDDNQLHLELGCTSVIVEEYNGDWAFVSKHIAT